MSSSPVAVLAAVSAAVVLLTPSAIHAGSRRPVDIPERFRGSDRAVVARVEAVTPVHERNAWGDELIVSHTTLAVEEILKGTPVRRVVLAVEGGTLDGLTLHVSDLPELAVGDRAVFFIKRTAPDRDEPHLRGLGILLLDPTNRVKDSGLTLDMIRQMAPPRPEAR
jgi:hypothetical protein